jgi:hypothetical protein
MNILKLLFSGLTILWLNLQSDVERRQQDLSANSLPIYTIDTFWSCRNLAVKFFLNGDAIPEAENLKAWNKAYMSKTPAWCYYNFNPENGEKYGIMYNQFALWDPRGLIPGDWQVMEHSMWNRYLQLAKENKGVPPGQPGEQCHNVLGGSMGSSYVGDLMKRAHYWGSTDRVGTLGFETGYPVHILQNEEGLLAEKLWKSDGNGHYIRCYRIEVRTDIIMPDDEGIEQR